MTPKANGMRSRSFMLIVRYMRACEKFTGSSFSPIRRVAIERGCDDSDAKWASSGDWVCSREYRAIVARAARDLRRLRHI